MTSTPAARHRAIAWIGAFTTVVLRKRGVFARAAYRALLILVLAGLVIAPASDVLAAPAGQATDTPTETATETAARST